MRDAKMTASTQESEDRRLPTRPKEEIARVGLEIYERDVRQQVEEDNVGRVVAIDVDSGYWALGEEVLDAVDSLRAQRPDAVNILSERVGFPALDTFGAWPLRGTE